MSQIIVGIAEMQCSKNQDDVLITYSLGSCLGVAMYDPIEKVAGLAHCMLPLSSIDYQRGKLNPYMFVDTCMPAMFNSLYKLGANKNNIILKVAGAAQILDEDGRFNIGKKNYIAIRELMWKNNVLITGKDIGGNQSRMMSVEVGTGKVFIKIGGSVKEL